MLQWLIQDVEVEIHKVSLLWDFVEATFFMLHLHKFDVAVVFF